MAMFLRMHQMFRPSNLILAVLLVVTLSMGCSCAKRVETIETKVTQLTEAFKRKHVLRLTGSKFRELVRNQPRNYSIVVMFTALNAKRKCVICQQAKEEYEIVAKSFRYSPDFSSRQLFLTLADFDEASDAFQIMKLTTAPVFMHFPMNGKPTPEDTMDLQRVGYDAPTIAKWISDQANIDIIIERPYNYAYAFCILLMAGMFALLLYLRRENLDFIYSKFLWSILILMFVITMLSGQMWNHIRGPPLFHMGEDGQGGFVHGSSQGQFVLESYFISMLYALISTGMILLIESSSTKTHDSKRQVFAYLGIAIFCVFFSLILSVFKSKAGGYPYSFLFK